MSRKGKHCIAFQWKDEKIYLPNVVISSDLRRIADNVLIGRDVSKVKNDDPKPEPEWNPSWDDDEDESGGEGGVQRDAGQINERDGPGPLSRTKRKKKGANVQESDSSSQRKPYSKEKLFKNWMDQPKQTDLHIGSKSCDECGIKITSNCIKCEACETKSKNLPLTQKSSKTGSGMTSADFKCEECEKVFKKRIQLNMHAKIHARMEKSASSEHSCTVCRISFQTSDALISHQLKVHNLANKNEEDNTLVCKRCNRVFERENQLKIHTKMCKVTKSSDVSSPVDQGCVTVSESASKNEASSLTCKKCDRVFERENQLKIHTKMCKVIKHNTVDLSAAKLVSSPASKSASKNEEITLTCQKCDRVFERENQLKFHTRMCKVVKQNSVEVSTAKLDSAPVPKSDSEDEDNTLVCQKCYRVFKRENQLKFHTKMCKAIKKDSPVPSASDQAHKPTIKKEENALACRKCDRVFERENQLKFHTNMCKAIKQNSVAPSTTHQALKPTIKTEENALTCKKCDRVFERENQLKFHTNMCKAIKKPSTTGQAPEPPIKIEKNQLACKKCDRVFERENQLKFHTNMCKAIKKPFSTTDQAPEPTIKIEENQLACKKCDRIFERENQLKFHSKICKAFKQNTHSSALKNEVNELTCKQCDRVFERPNQLNFHSKLCKGIKYPIGQPLKQEDCADITESDMKPFIESSNSVNEAMKKLDKIFTCADCGRKFDYEYEWKWHQRDHMKACKNCLGKFHVTKFNEHLKSCFRPVIKTEAISSSRSVLNKTANFVQPVYCNTCGKSFANFNILSQHNLLHKFGIETFEDVDENYLQRIMPFACMSAGCESRFSDKYDLEAHVRKGLHNHKEVLGYSNPTYYHIRSNEVPPLNPYVFLKTKEKVAADVLLTRIIAAGINMKSPFKRSPRGRAFREDIPIRSVYTCETCGKRFKIRQYYMIHISLHKRMEKYHCAKCQRRFQTEGLYQEHMGRHAADPNYISSPGKRFRHDIPIQDVYNCETCPKSFTERNLYITHMNQHKKERFPCEKCDRKFEFESMYKTHVKLHEDPDYDPDRPRRRFRHDIPIQDVYNCETCSKSFPGTERTLYIIHLNQHKKERFACDKCDRKFEFESACEAHVKLHEDPNYDPRRAGRRFRSDIPIQKVYTCEICEKKFNKRQLFLTHTYAHNKEKFSCNLCDRKFVSEGMLEAHLKRHEDPSYDPNRRPGRPFRYRDNVPIQETYTCELCSKTFEDRQVFLSHLSAHSREGKYTCKECGQKFQRAVLLEFHMKQHADPEYVPGKRGPKTNIPIQDVYTCDKCDNRQFTDRQKFICHLNYHKFAIRHNKFGKRKLRRSDIPIQDIYHCEKCPSRQFTDRTKYILHLYWHSKGATFSGKRKGRQPRSDIPVQDIYYCEQCEYQKSFTDRMKYILHIRNHNLERTHKCDGCLKVFKTVQTRDMHKEKFCKGIPCKYKCNQCSDRFHNKITLARHFQRYHSKSMKNPDTEIEFPCNQCSQTFNTTFGLTRHIQIYHPVSSNIEMQVDTGAGVHSDDISGNDDNMSSHSWDAHDDEDPGLLAASFCQAELNEMPSLEKEEETSGGSDNSAKRKLPRGSTLCQCGVNRKYKTQKFCHSLRCACVQNGNRCSKNCECDEGCLNSNEMEENQQQKFREGKESMMESEAILDYQHSGVEESNASTPILLGYNNENDDHYDEEPSTSSLSKLMPIPTSEFIAVDDGQDESIRQLTLEGYVEGAEDDDYYDPLGDSESPQAAEPEIEYQTEQVPVSRNPQSLLKQAITQETRTSISDSQTPVIISTSGSTASRKPSQPASAKMNTFDQTAKLRCQFCKKNFSILPTYMSHILLHDVENSSLTCPICCKEIPGQLSNYFEHLNDHNNGIDLQCTKCSSKFKTYGDMEKHLQIHHFRPMECGVCNIKFQNSQLMMSHWSKSHPTCQCGLCNVKYFSYEDLTFHMKSLHSPFDCIRCNERFNKHNELLDHFTHKHSTRTSNVQRAGQSKASQFIFKCVYCGDTFSNQDDFNEHLSNHLSQQNNVSTTKSQTNRYKCGQCNATFGTSDDLHDHLTQHLATSNWAHGDLKTEEGYQEEVNDNIQATEVFSCPKCSKTFTHRSAWRGHLGSHNLLFCSACDSVFETRVEMRNHLKTTSCKVHICEICDRNFNIKRYLGQHMRLVHGKDKEVANQAQKSLTPTAIANNMGFLTGRVTEAGGGNVQIVLAGSSVPVIVASKSLAQNQAVPRHGSRSAQPQNDIEEILIDSD